MTTPEKPEFDPVTLLLGGSATTPPPCGDCPDPDRLSAVVETGIGEEDEALAGHLSGCSDCRALLGALLDDPPPVAADDEDPEGTLADPAGDARHRQPVPEEAVLEAEGPPPVHFGPYRIVRRLGAGGMGVVYEGVHSVRGRSEAIKVVRRGLGQDPQFVERFHREVRGMAAISSDHVVPVFDSGEIDGELYYTMPLLPGPALDIVLHRIRRTNEAIPGAAALQVLDTAGFPQVEVGDDTPPVVYARRIAAAFAPVAGALQMLHDKGMLHRDIKPANLILGPSGRVMVADFGLVRTEDQTITRPDQLLGTPAYMSPEQILPEGHSIDGRADIYSLGATLYEFLTLDLPHVGDTVPETMARILRERPRPLRALNRHLPEDVETVVGRCLERRPKDRMATAGHLRDDLERIAVGKPVEARPVSPVTRLVREVRDRWMPFVAAAAIVGIAGAWWFTRPALLTVSAAIPAEVHLDGRLLGSTPIASVSIPPGEHVVELVRERFAPFRRRFSVDRGGAREIGPVTLTALDPSDPEILRIVLAAHGLQPTGFDYEGTRGAGDGDDLVAVLPRGALRAAPDTIELWAPDIVDGWTARIEDTATGAVVARWEIPELFDETRTFALPADATGRLSAGGAYRVVLADDGGSDRTTTAFRLLDGASLARIDARIADLVASLAEDDPVRDVLRYEVLLEEGLHAEAYAVATALESRIGRHRETARMRLAALERGDLSGVGPWADLLATWLAEPR